MIAKLLKKRIRSFRVRVDYTLLKRIIGCKIKRGIYLKKISLCSDLQLVIGSNKYQRREDRSLKSLIKPSPAASHFRARKFKESNK